MLRSWRGFAGVGFPALYKEPISIESLVGLRIFTHKPVLGRGNWARSPPSIPIPGRLHKPLCERGAQRSRAGAGGDRSDRFRRGGVVHRRGVSHWAVQRAGLEPQLQARSQEVPSRPTGETDKTQDQS